MKPIWKWVIGIVVTLLILVVAGAWYLSRHWKPILDAQIKEAVMRSTDSLYVIGYDDLNFNLITGNASLKGFRLTVDSGRYAELERRRQDWRPRESEFGSGAIWKYAQQVGPARYGALTHPGARGERECYADI